MTANELGAWGNKCVLESVVVTDPVHESTKIAESSALKGRMVQCISYVSSVSFWQSLVSRGWKPCERCVVTDTWANPTVSTTSVAPGPSSCLKLQTPGNTVTPIGAPTAKHQLSIPNFVFPSVFWQNAKPWSSFYRNTKLSETEQAHPLDFMLTSFSQPCQSTSKCSQNVYILINKLYTKKYSKGQGAAGLCFEKFTTRRSY